MEKRIINQKIDSLINCLNRIKSKEPFTSNSLKADFDIQDIVSVNLERSIQNCIDIASHIAADFDDVHGLSSASLFVELGNKKIISQETAVNLSRAVGFRNLLVHRYAIIPLVI
jgi:uncharacterized protein YutE (UPF0331/DUF86 family)